MSDADPSAALAQLTGQGASPADDATAKAYQGLMAESARGRKAAAEYKGAAIGKEEDKYASVLNSIKPPAPPDLKPWTQPPPENDPLRSFGSWASVIGIIGSALTRTPITSALNASAAAMQAYRANDLQKYAEAKDAWKENTELAIKQAEWEQKQYNNIVDRAKQINEVDLAKIQAQAAAMHDSALATAIQAQGIEGYYQIMSSRQTLLEKSQKILSDGMALSDKVQQQMAVKADVAPRLEAALKANPNMTPQQKQMLEAQLTRDAMVQQAVKEKAQLTEATFGGKGWQMYETNDGKMYRVNSQSGVVQKKAGDNAWTDEDTLPESARKLGAQTAQSKYGDVAKEYAADIDKIGRGLLPAPNSRSELSTAIMNEVAKKYPSYNAADYPVQAKARQAFATGTQGNTVRAFSTAISHLDALAEAKAVMDSGDLPAANQAANAVATTMGRPDVVTYDALKQIVADEIFKGIVPGQGTAGERNALSGNFNSADTPAQFEGVKNGFMTLMGGQIVELERQYKRTTRDEKGFVGTGFLSPGAEKVFEDFKNRHEKETEENRDLKTPPEDVLSQARAAIASGKSKEAVIQRLSEHGYAGDGL